MPLWTKVLSPMTLTTRRASLRRQHVAHAQSHADGWRPCTRRCPWPGTAAARPACSSRCRRRRCSRGRAGRRRHCGAGSPCRAREACRRAARARARRRRPECGARARRSARRSGTSRGLPSTAMPAARIASSQIGVAFLDHDAALDAGGETRGSARAAADRSVPSLRNAASGAASRACMEGDARSDDAERRDRRRSDPIGPSALVPARDSASFCAQAPMRRPGVGGDHHAAGDIAHEVRLGRRLPAGLRRAQRRSWNGRRAWSCAAARGSAMARRSRWPGSVTS